MHLELFKMESRIANPRPTWGKSVCYELPGEFQLTKI